MAEDDGTIKIRAVLDRSAILSYARGHVHVGELVVDIAAEGAYMGLPTVALMDAHVHLLGDPQARARLAVLAALPGITVLPLGPEQAAAVAPNVTLAGGDFGRAHALWAALEHEAYYLTTEPERAPSALTKSQVHRIPSEDA